MKKNEVAVKEALALTVENKDMMAEWGYQDIDSTDIKIPKILLMQGLSEKVTTGDAAMGDLVDSISGEILGTCREKGYAPIRVIPIDMFKTWAIYEVLGAGKLDYVKTVPESVETAAWRKEYEYEEDGRNYKRVHNLNFYVLLERDLGNPLCMPYVITFRSSSYTVGTVISNHFANCLRAKQKGIFLVPPSVTFEIGGELIKDEHNYYKFKATQAGKTTEQGVAEAFSWLKTIKTSKTQVVGDDEESSSKASLLKDVGAATTSYSDLDV